MKNSISPIIRLFTLIFLCFFASCSHQSNSSKFEHFYIENRNELLYFGYTNIIEVKNDSLLQFNIVDVESDYGTVSSIENNSFIFTAKYKDDLTQIVFTITICDAQQNQVQLIDSIPINRFPIPVFKLGNLEQGSISKDEIINQKGLIGFPPKMDNPPTIHIQIDSFKMQIVSNKPSISFSKSPLLSNEQKQLLQETKTGDSIIFSDIHFKNIDGYPAIKDSVIYIIE